MARGRSINLYLMDEVATGRIKCTLANWTGVSYKIPRDDVEKCKDREDLYQSGIYFLFGRDSHTDGDVVYVGKAGSRKNGEGLLYRLQEHKRNIEKDYWEESIVFTTSNNSFGPTEISYLENRFTVLARECGRYIVKNVNEPTRGNVTEEKESELEEFIDYAKIVIGALGHKVFENRLQKQTRLDVPVENLPGTIEEDKTDGVVLDSKSQLFYINNPNCNACGVLVSKGFVVLKGSKISSVFTKSCPTYVMSHRNKNKEKFGADFVLTEDVLFTTPSGAGGFVMGSSVNGFDVWKTKDGVPLKHFKKSI